LLKLCWSESILSKSSGFKIQRYPQQVRIVCNGVVVAESDRSKLLIETYAPDIYIPIADINTDILESSDTRTACPKKGEASYWTINAGDVQVADAMWAYEAPLSSCSELAGFAAFDFQLVETYVNDQLVRGHVRDPNKVIKTEQMHSHLQMKIAGETVVDARSYVLLYESGLPVRYYVPESAINSQYLIESDRQSVCTYKGEAVYWHIYVGDETHENVVWSYPEPWLDFSADVKNIKAFYGLYASAFDAVLVDGIQVEENAANKLADAAMQSSPTIDTTLAAKLKQP